MRKTKAKIKNTEKGITLIALVINITCTDGQITI